MKRNNIRKWISGALCAALLFSLTACGGTETETPTESGESGLIEAEDGYTQQEQDWENRYSLREQYPVEESFLSGVNTFAWRTAAGVLPEGEENVCYSPLSLYYALALAAEGANGTTAEQLTALLGADEATLGEQCGRLMKLLSVDDSISTLLLANSLWLNQEEANFSEDYLSKAEDSYGASLHAADFSLPETGEAIADWISENTKGKLSYTPEVNEEMLMAILNTVYLKDNWTDPFSETETSEDTFTKADGETVQCDFMHKTDTGALYTGENYTCATLSLNGTDGVTFVLPAEGVTPESLLTDEALMEEIMNRGTEDADYDENYCQIQWSVPKFTIKSELRPVEALQALGVTDAFSGAADFSGMADEALYISDILQGTYFSLNEDGVEAAAYTMMMVEATALEPEDLEQKEMKLDRPFLFILTAEDAVLFAGVCGNPAA